MVIWNFYFCVVGLWYPFVVIFSLLLASLRSLFAFLPLILRKLFFINFVKNHFPEFSFAMAIVNSLTVISIPALVEKIMGAAAALFELQKFHMVFLKVDIVASPHNKVNAKSFLYPRKIHMIFILLIGLLFLKRVFYSSLVRGLLICLLEWLFGLFRFIFGWCGLLALLIFFSRLRCGFLFEPFLHGHTEHRL